MHGCAARAAYVMAKEFRYISNEYTLHGGMHKMGDTHLCPQFVNVVMLRWVGLWRGWQVYVPATLQPSHTGAMNLGLSSQD